MTTNKVRPLSAALLFLLLALFSCKKQDNGTGIGLFSRNTNLDVAYLDTFQVNTVPFRVANIRSSGYQDVMLGAYKDPYFGNTKINLYTQFSVGSNGKTFEDQAVCDSIVFYAKLGNSRGESFYGGNNNEMTFNVFRVQEDAIFTTDSLYYSDSSLPIYSQSLLDPEFNNTFASNFVDSVQIGLDTLNKYPGVFKLKLDPAFGQEMIDLNGTEVLSNISEFLKVFKGLFMTTENTEDGSVIYFDFGSNATTMMLYYHVDTVAYDYEFLVISNSTAHFTQTIHDYEVSGSSQLQSVLIDSTLGNQNYFLQAGAGFDVNLRFPALETLLDSFPFLPINKAELIMPVSAEEDVTSLAPPSRLLIRRVNEDGEQVSILDAATSRLDGNYNIFTNEYRFVITRHIQSYLNGEIPNADLLFSTIYQSTSANRVLLNGHDADTTGGVKNLKLRIYYSTLEN